MNHPLVSVIIITYNSSATVVETLESIKQQTYKNIELIVADDCSKDDTVDICKKWIESNQVFFVRTAILAAEQNTGTSANCNRGLRNSNGEWIKIIAGDDALFPECIEKFVDFVNSHQEAKFVVGNAKEYKYTFDDDNEIDLHVKNYNNHPLLKEPADVQFKNMLHGDYWIFTPAVFYNVDMLRNVGGWDEKYGIHEDFPMFHKLLREGFKCYGLDAYVVKYRVGDSNVWGNLVQLFNYEHLKAQFHIEKDLCFQYYSCREKVRSYTFFGKIWIMNKMGMRKKTIINKGVGVFLSFTFAVLTLDVKQLYSYFQAAMRLL